jgi:hypothetical protein
MIIMELKLPKFAASYILHPAARLTDSHKLHCSGGKAELRGRSNSDGSSAVLSYASPPKTLVPVDHQPVPNPTIWTKPLLRLQ